VVAVVRGGARSVARDAAAVAIAIAIAIANNDEGVDDSIAF